MYEQNGSEIKNISDTHHLNFTKPVHTLIIGLKFFLPCTKSLQDYPASSCQRLYTLMRTFQAKYSIFKK